jgi:DNA-binding GntR family transcriptional regulator
MIRTRAARRVHTFFMMEQKSKGKTKLKRSADTGERLFQRLVESIVSAELRPGEPLREARLAAEWGVSRTPLRESVRRAAALGLVELRPNQRPLVRCLTSDDVAKLFVVRETLELLALDLAWERLDSAALEPLLRHVKSLHRKKPGAAWVREALLLDSGLHRLGIDLGGNPWLTLAMENLWTFVRILQGIVAEQPRHVASAFEEHEAILQALADRDKVRARTLLKEHLRSAAVILCAQLGR